MLKMESLPPAPTLHKLPQKERERVLDVLFEPSRTLRSISQETLEREAISSYDDLITTIGKKLTALAKSESPSDISTLHSILRSHPRLGASRVESAQSQAEQAQMHSGDRREGLILAELNESYERTFPGMCYVTFVNGRPRSVIMQDMRSRIQRRDQKQEELDAIQAMCDIASDRARKLTT